MRMCECGSRIHINPHPTRNWRSYGRIRNYRDHDLCRRCFPTLINQSKMAAKAA